MKEVAQTCALCGKPSIVYDSRFVEYTPCEDHVHLSPMEYSHLTYEKEQQ